MLVSLEGLDGVGKTTVAHLVAARLRERGITCATMTYRDTPLARQLVELAKQVRTDSGDTSGAELCVFAAAWLDVLARQCNSTPVSDVVVCDRYFDMTIAVNRAAGVPEHQIRAVTMLLYPRHLPTLSILLTTPLEVARDRRRQRPGAHEWIDRADQGLVVGIECELMRMATADDSRWRIIDADRPRYEVSGDVEDAILAALDQSG
jgi:dTMP kinase